MYQKRFLISCMAITVTAFALLAVTANNVWDDYLFIMQSYGIGILTSVAVLIAIRFVWDIGRKFRQDRQTQVSSDDKLAWYRSYFRGYPWVNVLAATATLIVTITSFSTYKSAVVGAGGYGFDAMFIGWDRLFFAGNDAWIVTHAVFDSSEATKWIDFLYHPTFLPMILVYLLAITSTSLQALRQTYILAYLAGWVLIGMVGAGSLNSAGPVFDGVLYGDGTIFGPLKDRLQAQLAAGGGPITADPIRQYLLSVHQSGDIRFGGGISAMPSMHMALVFLWVFPAWNINRIFGFVIALYAGIIWVGSVHLGWHYFVDGLVSLIVIGILWRIAGHIVGLYGQPQTTRATT